MNKYLFALLLLTFSSFSMAGTGLNCLEVDKMGSGEVKVCGIRSDRDLNDFYQQLLKKLDKQKASFLREAQRAWLELRAAQCNMISLNAKNEKITKDRCEIKITEIRARELEDLLLTIQ